MKTVSWEAERENFGAQKSADKEARPASRREGTVGRFKRRALLAVLRELRASSGVISMPTRLSKVRFLSFMQ